MVRRFSVLVFVVAALIAVEPLLHSHPLEQNQIPSSCAICATGTTPLPQATPALAAPQVVVYTLVAGAVPLFTAITEVAIPSRAPPA